MKVITTTRADRPQTRALVSDQSKVHFVNENIITVSVPFIIEAKDMFLTFTKQEVRAMLDAIEVRENESANFVNTLKGMNRPSDSDTPSGPLV